MSKHTSGPWKAHFNVPTAVIEGHIIKADHGAECPIASLWVGGGTKGKPTQIANAHLIAAAPDMSDFIDELIDYADEHGAQEAWWYADARALQTKAREV